MERERGGKRKREKRQTNSCAFVLSSLERDRERERREKETDRRTDRQTVRHIERDTKERSIEITLGGEGERVCDNQSVSE